jgi:hypothetical protein
MTPLQSVLLTYAMFCADLFVSVFVVTKIGRMVGDLWWARQQWRDTDDFDDFVDEDLDPPAGYPEITREDIEVTRRTKEEPCGPPP